MKRHFILFHFILSTGFGSWSAQAQGQSDHFVLPPGKAIYQPKEFAGQDWYSDTSATPTGACPVRIIWPYSGKKDSGTI